MKKLDISQIMMDRRQSISYEHRKCISLQILIHTKRIYANCLTPESRKTLHETHRVYGTQTKGIVKSHSIDNWRKSTPTFILFSFAIQLFGCNLLYDPVVWDMDLNNYNKKNEKWIMIVWLRLISFYFIPICNYYEKLQEGPHDQLRGAQRRRGTSTRENPKHWIVFWIIYSNWSGRTATFVGFVQRGCMFESSHRR